MRLLARPELVFLFCGTRFASDSRPIRSRIVYDRFRAIILLFLFFLNPNMLVTFMVPRGGNDSCPDSSGFDWFWTNFASSGLVCMIACS